MKDYAIRAISQDGQVRGFAALTTQTVQELQRRHQTLPIASAALGRTATMGAMMGLTLKEDRHKLTITVDGDGPLGKIVVDANGKGEVRGYVEHPEVIGNAMEDYKLDVGSAVGQGNIYIVKDLGLKDPYRGASPIITGELGDDFTYYFVSSDQVPSSVGLGVYVKREEILVAGGYFVQTLPGASDDVIDQLEQNISKITSITRLLSEGITPEQLLAQILGEGVQILEKKEIHHHCPCSHERTEAMLKSLGKTELQSIIDEIGHAEVICHFCNEKYLFNAEELKGIIAQID